MLIVDEDEIVLSDYEVSSPTFNKAEMLDVVRRDIELKMGRLILEAPKK